MQRVVFGLSAIAFVILAAWDLTDASILQSCYGGPPRIGYNWCEFITLDLLRAVQAVVVAAGVVAAMVAVQSGQRSWFAAIVSGIAFFVVELGGLATAIGCSFASQACSPGPHYSSGLVQTLLLIDRLLPFVLPMMTLVYASLLMRGFKGRPEGLEVSSMDEPTQNGEIPPVED